MFYDENILKSMSFNFTYNTQTIPKKHQNNFEKVHKSTFLTKKKGEMLLISDTIFRFTLAKNIVFEQKPTKIEKSASN